MHLSAGTLMVFLNEGWHCGDDLKLSRSALLSATENQNMYFYKRNISPDHCLDCIAQWQGQTG